MKLFFKKLGQGQPLIILHGLLGSLDNWMTIGRHLSTHFEVSLLDSRNHGHSPRSNIFNFQAGVDDLHEFILDYNLKNAIVLGHSMGGKITMLFAQQHPKFLDKIIVVDVAPKHYPMHDWTLLDDLLQIDITNRQTRSEVEERLSQLISKPHMVQFLLKNVYRTANGELNWRFNLNVIHKEIGSLIDNINITTVATPTLFIKGGDSDYFLEEDFQKCKSIFPNATLATIPNAGHWVQADQPLLFEAAVLKYLLNSNH